MRSYNRNFGKIYETMYNDHNAVYNTGIDLKEFFKILNMGRIAYNEQGGDDMTFRATRIATLTSSVINFCRQVDGTMRSNVEFDRVIGSNKNLHPLKGLENVLDLKSYNEWKKHVGRFIKSDRIKSIASYNNLEDFFCD
jgi:ribosome-interacting GTPase 1